MKSQKQNQTTKADEPTNVDILYEEAKEKSQQQVETSRWLQEQASQLLRLFLTVFSLLLAAASIVFSTFSPSSWSTSTFDPRIPEIARELASYPHLHYNLALVVYAVFFLSSFFFFVLSIWSFLFQAPSNIVGLLSLESLNTTPDINDMAKNQVDHSDEEIREKLLSQYIDIIDENKSKVKKNRRKWQSGYSHLVKGVNRLFISMFLIFPIYVFREGWFGILTFVMSVIFLISWIKEEFEKIGLEKLKVIDKRIDVGWLILTVYVAGVNSSFFIRGSAIETFASLFALITMASMVYTASSLESEMSFILLYRTVVVSTAIFIIFLFFTLNSTETQTSVQNPGILILVSASSSGIYTIVLILLGEGIKTIRTIVARGREKLRNWR